MRSLLATGSWMARLTAEMGLVFILCAFLCGCRVADVEFDPNGITEVEFDKKESLVVNIEEDLRCYGSVTVRRHGGKWYAQTPEGPMWEYQDEYAFYFKHSGYVPNDFYFTLRTHEMEEVQLVEAEGTVVVDKRRVKIHVKARDKQGRMKDLPINGTWKIDEVYPDDF